MFLEFLDCFLPAFRIPVFLTPPHIYECIVLGVIMLEGFTLLETNDSCGVSTVGWEGSMVLGATGANGCTSLLPRSNRGSQVLVIEFESLALVLNRVDV